MNLNSCCLTGNLTRDPELRTTGGGTSVCSLRLAVNERYKNSSTGEWEERANYFDVTVFGKQGESCNQYLSKGRPVAVEGRLRWREWEKDGQKRQAVEVVANNVQFLGGREDGGGGGSRSRETADLPADTSDFDVPATVGGADDDIPFAHEVFPFEFDLWHGHANR